MAYITCSNCGAKALEIATRCPRCQHPFPSREERRASEPVRAPKPKAPWYIGGLALLVVAGAWIAWSTSRQAAADRKAAAARVIPVEVAPAPDTTAPGVPDSTTLIPAASTPVAPTPQSVTVAPARVAPKVRAPARSAPPESTEWKHAVVALPVNVREKSERGAKVLLVLAKGDTVLIGEQITGWTHVRVDGIDGWADSRRLTGPRSRLFRR